MNLFVAKLSPSTTSDDLQKIFSAYGEVTSDKIIFDKETGNSKGYGFVEMDSEASADEALKNMNGKELAGRNVKVNKANSQSEA